MTAIKFIAGKDSRKEQYNLLQVSYEDWYRTQ